MATRGRPPKIETQIAKAAVEAYKKGLEVGGSI